MSAGNGSRSGATVIRPAASGTAASIGGDPIVERDRAAAEVVDARASGPAAAREDQGGGHVLSVLEQGPAAERDPERDAKHGRRDGGGRAAGHALVATGAIDGHRAEADARDARVGPVDAGRALVGELVHAVVVARVGVGVLLEPTGHRIHVGRRVHADRAGVDDGRHARPPALDGLEDVDGAGHVDLRPERRIGAAERHLQRREVDDVRDAVLVERSLDRPEVGDVAHHEIDPGQLVRLQGQGDPARVATEIEGDDGHAFANERAHRPGADAPERAR